MPIPAGKPVAGTRRPARRAPIWAGRSCHPEYGGELLTLLIGLGILSEADILASKVARRRAIDRAVTTLFAKLKNRDLAIAVYDPVSGKYRVTG